MSIPVVTVGSAQEAVVGGLERLHGPVTVVRRCSELAELIAACQSGLAVAAVVAEGCEELTTTLVDRLGAVGVSIIALTDDPSEAKRLYSIGAVPAVTGIEAADLAAKISEAVGRESRQSSSASARDTGFADPAADLLLMPVTEPVDEKTPAGEGQIIAVWGPIGAPGRTVLAVNIAAELAADGKSVVLVDADSYGASVSAVLGLLDESAGLAQACRLADQGLLDVEALKSVAVPVFTKAGTSEYSRALPGRIDGQNSGRGPSRWSWKRPGNWRIMLWWTQVSAWNQMKSLASTPWLRVGMPPPCAAWKWLTLCLP
jgi:Flp pilus assembly CpaE family ATPase